MHVRVRVAPSPTGKPHIGTIRTALFNYLFARKHAGTFILRIDDTDQARSKPEHVEDIKQSLKWIGMDWDEGPDKPGQHGPYFQSQKFDRYREVTDRLLKEGKAFTCYCSAEELETKRKLAAQNKVAPRYDGRCVNLTDDQVKQFEAEGRKPAIRFKVEPGPAVRVRDLIRGNVDFPRDSLDHFIIVRSDGKPVYNFVTAVDEVDMAITHVIRGDDHLSNTPKQILIAEALGFEVPTYAHLPQILGLDKARLSKRHGAQGVMELAEEGFLPEAVFNFLALLGWSWDDKTEIFSRKELEEKFDLDRVGKAPAVFDEQKLLWMNGMYLRAADENRILPELVSRMESVHPAAKADRAYTEKVGRLLRESLKTLGEVAEASAFFFKDEVAWEDEASKKLSGWPKAKEILAAVSTIVAEAEPFTPEELEKRFRSGAEAAGLKFKDFVHLTRFATTGRTAGPSLFHLIEVLGRERCRQRLKDAVGILG